jgi:murein L,D-transpeptidase YafK
LLIAEQMSEIAVIVKASVGLLLTVGRDHSVVLAVVVQFKRLNVNCMVRSYEDDVVAFWSYLKVNYLAFELWWLDVAQGFKCEGVVKDEEVLLVRY